MPRSAVNDYTQGFDDGLGKAAALIDAQDWAMFAQKEAGSALKARAWLRDAIRKLMK